MSDFFGAEFAPPDMDWHATPVELTLSDTDWRVAVAKCALSDARMARKRHFECPPDDPKRPRLQAEDEWATEAAQLAVSNAIFADEDDRLAAEDERLAAEAAWLDAEDERLAAEAKRLAAVAEAKRLAAVTRNRAILAATNAARAAGF